MIEITINLGDLGVKLDAITSGLVDLETVHEVASLAVETAWRQHLAARYVPRDKDGVDFWADVANSMESAATATAGVVSVDELGARLRYSGGTVTPGKSISSYTGKLTRALAIPSARVPVVEGRRVRPGRAGPLAFVKATEGNLIGYLFEGEVTGTISRGKNKGKPRVRRNGPLMYTLLTRQTTLPDPDIIPADDVLSGAASAAVLDLITAGF